MVNWLDRRLDEQPEWQRAAWFGDMLLHLTAEELAALDQRIEELAAPYEQRVFDPERRPTGSRLVTVLRVAVPIEGEAGE